MIIFGWRSKGEADWSGFLNCQRCAQLSPHYGIRLKRYFTIFFIPIIPLWSDSKTVCSDCLYETKLGPEEYIAARELAQTYYDMALLAKRDPERYRSMISEMERRGSLPEAQPLAIEEPERATCTSCGTSLNELDKFCTSCGVET